MCLNFGIWSQINWKIVEMEIDWITLLTGCGALLFGIGTFILRLKAPEKFGKLEAMKERWGERNGRSLHVFAYSVVPVLFGISMIVKAVTIAVG